jgi:hypothetical protein
MFPHSMRYGVASSCRRCPYMQMFDRKDDPSIFSNPTVKEVAEKLGKSPAQVTLLALPMTAACLHITGAMTISRHLDLYFLPKIRACAGYCKMRSWQVVIALIQVVLRWGLQRGTVVIPKASTDEHLKVQIGSQSIQDPVAAWLRRLHFERFCRLLVFSTVLDTGMHAQNNLDVLDWELSDEDFKSLSGLQPQRRMVDGSIFCGDDKPYKVPAYAIIIAVLLSANPDSSGVLIPIAGVRSPAETGAFSLQEPSQIWDGA